LATEYVFRPVHIRIGKNEQLNACRTVQQVVQVMQEQQKTSTLLKLFASLRQEAQERAAGDKILIFVNRKVLCQKLVSSLCNHGYAADFIHGDRPQAEREAILSQFRAPFAASGQKGSTRLQYLVATDVAARGIDVKDITVVVNYDFPMAVGASGVEEYVHRIGRTGRAGATGRAFTFFTSDNAKCAHELVQVLRNSSQEIPTSLRKLDRGKSSESARSNARNTGKGKGGDKGKGGKSKGKGKGKGTGRR
jgi:ATP-dependent RNA helicase DDX5/DBP2